MNGPVHVGSWPVGSPEWHEARRTTINGSEIAAVMGISPYDSPFSLWHRKAGALSEVEQTPEMFWGTALEGVIRDEFARRHADECDVFDGGGLWRHGKRPWQGGSPDGQLWLLSDSKPVHDKPDALIEVKTARFDFDWGDEGTDEIPVQYRAQILWYLDVFDLQTCHVPVLIAGSEYREYLVSYDGAEVAAMRTAARAFLDTLEAGVMPPIDSHDATYQAVRELHPDLEAVEVELDDNIARPYLLALAACRDAADEKCRTSAEVITAMGAAQHATWLGDRIASRIPARAEGAPPYLRAVNGAANLLREATS